MNSVKQNAHPASSYTYTYILRRDENDIKELLEGHPKVFFALLNKSYVISDRLFSNKEEAIQAARSNLSKGKFQKNDGQFDYWIISLKGAPEKLITQWPESDREFANFYDRIESAENNVGQTMTTHEMSKLNRK